MTNYTYLNLLLILIACVAHYPIGRLFGVKKFFSGILVGLSMSALVIGFLANFMAALIRPFALLVILVGLILLVVNFKKYNFKSNIWLYVGLAVFAAVIFIFNNPLKIFIKDQILLFNPHYSYYANQPIEMLNARYFSRLQVAQFLPYEWGRYHFFNASVQAVIQSLVLHPNILTYFFAELIISIIGLTVLLENFLTEFGLKIKTAILSLVWIIVGFTLFANSLGWNLMTTGTLTVPAMVLVILSAYKKDVGSFIIYTLILGASAFRILPISLVLLVLLAIHLYQKANAAALIDRIKQTLKLLVPNILFFSAYLFFFLYNLATFVLGKVASVSGINIANSELYYYNGWNYPLASYKIAGLFNHLKGGVLIFSKYKDYGYANGVLNPRIVFAILAILGIIAAVFLIKFVFSKIKKRPALSFAVIPLILLALIPLLYAQLDLKLLFVLTLPYLVFALALLDRIARSPEERRRFYILYIWVFATAVAFQFTGIDLAQKAPVLYVVCDIALWGILGLFLFSRVNKFSHIAFFLVVSLMLIPIFNFHLKGMLAIDEKTQIDLKPLAKMNYSRSGFVSSTSNLCNFAFSSSIKDPIQTDAYSTFVGCNLNFKDENNGFISYGFIAPK